MKAMNQKTRRAALASSGWLGAALLSACSAQPAPSAGPSQVAGTVWLRSHGPQAEIPA